MKPKSWKECPDSVFERFLWDLDLKYDSYESSKAERIHEIMNGSIYQDNERIINSGWAILSEDDFRRRCHNAIDSLKSQLEQLKQFV